MWVGVERVGARSSLDPQCRLVVAVEQGLAKAATIVTVRHVDSIYAMPLHRHNCDGLCWKCSCSSRRGCDLLKGRGRPAVVLRCAVSKTLDGIGHPLEASRSDVTQLAERRFAWVWLALTFMQ